MGAMLDMLTDRCALLALVMYCGHLYPSYMLFFQMSAVIDIASHWLHFHVTYLMGKTSHKVLAVLLAHEIMDFYGISRIRAIRIISLMI
ncbi:unnamed protein product [Gongylonema pulchrum]|uniref:CDP-diacylglycerol--inositol 3-phosphatidyltransferase n=1 Tax=Gongylonema pulchrum TaxID=637853 RepID=A0A3P6TAM1_9BILA|nr:unnamed protein product [Gongylonema pulchrum]